MKKFLKVIIPIFMVFISAALGCISTFAVETWPAPPETASESIFSIDISTGSVLIEKNADAQRYPASTTKILTCLLVLENAAMDEVVTFSEASIALEEGAVTIDAIPGEQMSVKDTLYGLMLESGNDCAVALAEHVAGSVEAFANMMNERAALIGCKGSHFTNPHGLFDADHYTTARDMALIAMEAYKNSTFLQIVSTDEYTASPTNMTPEPRVFENWDLLVDPESEYYEPDVIGGKTGYLDEAGRCLVTFAKRDDLTVITSQFKGEYTGIFSEAKTLIDYDFDNFALRNASLEDRRFSGMTAEGGASLDPGAEILSLRNVPFSDIDAKLVFADEMSDEQKKAAGDEEIFGALNYSYAGKNLGTANIFLTKKQAAPTPEFIKVYYINGWTVALFCVIILVIIFSVYFTKKAAAPRSRGRRVR